jgi:hypothetical protein
MWEHDHSVGAKTWDEIAQSILACDRFVYLATPASASSYGQTEERGTALNAYKDYAVFRVDGGECPNALSSGNYASATTETIPEAIERYASRTLSTAPTEQNGGNASVRQWRSYLHGLRGDTSGIDPLRLSTCTNEVLSEYESATVITKTGRLRQVLNEPPPDFMRIAYVQRVDLAKFNAQDWHWLPFAGETGRGIALGERRYMFDVASKAPLQQMSASLDNGFAGLLAAVERMAAEGSPPTTLLAPTKLMPDLHTGFGNDLDWNPPEGDGTRLRTLGYNLKVYWSSRSMPLDRFVLVSSDRCLWHVCPDPATGHALTLVIARSKLHRQQLEWIAESTVKFELPKGAATAVPCPTALVAA